MPTYPILLTLTSFPNLLSGRPVDYFTSVLNRRSRNINFHPPVLGHVHGDRITIWAPGIAISAVSPRRPFFATWTEVNGGVIT